MFEGRGWQVQGAHTKGYNGIGYAICFIGNFVNSGPTDAAIQAAQSLISVTRLCHLSVQTLLVLICSFSAVSIWAWYPPTMSCTATARSEPQLVLATICTDSSNHGQNG